METAWIIAFLCALLCIIVVVVLVSMGVPQAGDMQQTAVDIETARPYLWEIASFFGVLAILRSVQSLKKWRCFPAWMCDVKQSSRGMLYKKLKNGWLDTIATLGSFGVIYLCLVQKYPDTKQVAIISAIAALSQFMLVKMIFSVIATRSPRVAEILSEGLYTSADDQTVMTRVVRSVVGGGVDKREDPTEPKLDR